MIPAEAAAIREATSTGSKKMRYASLLKRSKNFLPLIGMATVAACGSSDLTGMARQAVSFSFATRTSAAAAATSVPSASRADLVLGTNGQLVLTRIEVVLSRLELTRTDAETCVSGDTVSDNRSDDHSEGEAEGCEDVSRDPMVIDIPVDATVHTQIKVPLAAGTYTKLEARLAPATAAALLAAHPELAGASIRVTGTFNGTAFTFTTALRTKIEMEFNPPLVVDATTQNATVNIDVSKWFMTSSGAIIDPSTANAGGPNAATVAANIRASFHAFEDDDRSGEDRHGSDDAGTSGGGN